MGNIIDISDRFNIQNKKLEIFNNVANKKGLRNEIKKYNNINQNKYIELTKTIRNSAPNLIENIMNVSSLTSIFLTFDKKIDEIDLKMLEIMLFDKIINQKSIEDIKKDYERKI